MLSSGPDLGALLRMLLDIYRSEVTAGASDHTKQSLMNEIVRWGAILIEKTHHNYKEGNGLCIQLE